MNQLSLVIEKNLCLIESETLDPKTSPSCVCRASPNRQIVFPSREAKVYHQRWPLSLCTTHAAFVHQGVYDAAPTPDSYCICIYTCTCSTSIYKLCCALRPRRLSLRIYFIAAMYSSVIYFYIHVYNIVYTFDACFDD